MCPYLNFCSEYKVQDDEIPSVVAGILGVWNVWVIGQIGDLKGYKSFDQSILDQLYG